MKVTIQSATVPGTDCMIEVVKGEGLYTAERDPGESPLARVGNYLALGRDTEAEAREAANFLWRDTIERRNAYDAERAAEASKPAPVEITEGFWKHRADIYKVQASLSSGNLYAKRAMPEGGFQYDPGAIRKLREGGAEPLDAEAAAAFGKLYGYCGICGRTLTNEASIERGIGPVCATNMGW